MSHCTIHVNTQHISSRREQTCRPRAFLFTDSPLMNAGPLPIRLGLFEGELRFWLGVDFGWK
jgi:hypothetical protein